MMKAFGPAFAIVLCFGSAGLFHNPATSTAPSSAEESVNAPFRDGNYLGTLAAERGETPYLAVGRWVSSADRASFVAGYQRAYKTVLQSR